MITQSDPHLIARCEAFSRAAAALTVAVGCLVLAGWLFDIAALKRMLPGLATMKANTALGFLLCGVALALLNRSQRGAQICAGVAALMGALSLGEYLTGWNFGIDQLLFADPATPIASYPGRMSPTTALNFVLVGGALLLLDQRRGWKTGQWFALVACVVATLALVGYAYDVRSLYKISIYSGMALHTAITFIALSFGMLSACPERGLIEVITGQGSGGLLARRLLPAAIVIPLFVGWLRLQGQRAGFYGTEFGLALFATSNVLIFVTLTWWNAKALNRTDTARREAETALRASEELFSTAFWLSPDYMAIVRSADSVVIRANEAICRLWNGTAEEIIGKPSKQYVTWLTQDERQAFLKRLSEQGLIEDYETTLRMPGNRLIPFSMSCRMVTLNGEQCILITMRDITERKQAEEALRESEGKLRKVIDGLGPYMFVGLMTPDGVLIEANRPALAAAGLQLEDVLGKPFVETYWWAYSEEVQAQLAAAIARAVAGEPSRYEVQLRVAETTLIWIDFSLLPVHDAGGDVIFLVPSANIINERKRAEEANERALQRLTEAQRIGQMGDWEFDLATGSITWSPQTFEIVGRDPSLGPPQNYEENATLYEPASAALMAEKVAAAIASGEAQEYELVALRPDGQRVSVQAMAVPRKDETGKVVALYGTIQNITERKEAEAALREIQSHLEEAQRIAHVGSWLWESGTDTSSWSKELYAMMGIDPTGPAPNRDTIYQLYTAKSVADLKFAVAKAMEDGTPYAIELEHVRSDGSRKWFLSRGERWFDAHGQFKGLRGTLLDITERKRAEEINQRYAAIIASSDDAIISKTTEGIITSWNPGAERLFGYAGEEVIGQPMSVLVPPEHLNEEAEIIARIARGEHIEHFETVRVRKDGQRIDVSVAISPITDASGKVIGASKIAHDITERKRAEERLQESEARMRLATETTGVGIWEWNIPTDQIRWDAQMFRIYGVIPTPAGIIPYTTWKGAVLPEDLIEQEESLQNTVRCLGSSSREFRILRSDNNECRHIQSVETVRANPQGQAEWVVGTNLDITARRQDEEALTAYSRKLEQSNRELQEFAYVASHDLQEPLRAIQNFSERLRTKHADALNDEGRDYLLRMQNAASRMRVLIQDLLAYSRVTTKPNPFTLADLSELARTAVTDLSQRLEESGGHVEIGELPVIEADATQMRQLLQNLIGNALKFHRQGESPLVKVQALNGEASGMVRLAVEDNGIGFDEKYLDRIFTPFQRLHGRGQYEGTGIGLAICRKIVERHGGELTANSAPGHGATFFVTLPVRQTKRET